MFVGREKELQSLMGFYSSNRFEFLVLYGRRRIGKTALINEFIKDKPSIYFTGIESDAKQNLVNFSRCIYEWEDDNAPVFLNFQSALEHLFHKSLTQRFVLVIDEYPYVAKASKSFASTLQMLIDKYKDKSKLFLILCGSSMSFMEENVLGYKSPLYGRRTGQMKIAPFSFAESRLFFSGMTVEEQVLAYGVVGGTPQYLAQYNPKVSVEENVKRLYLTPTSFLFEETSNLLQQEVREPAIYNAIIAAIANGASKMSEIASAIGEPSNVCAKYIKNLISLGILIKHTPYGESSKRKTVYSIEDNMFRFWYRFVQSNITLIVKGNADLVYKRIEPFFSHYLGKIFEEICKQYLWDLRIKEELPVEFADLGSWWGSNPKTKSQEEIDIMADNGDTALFAECKWTNEPIRSAVLRTLIERSNLFHYKIIYYYLFSRSGFSKACITEASKFPNIKLITMHDMFPNNS